MALCAARDWLRCIVLFIRFDRVLSPLDDCFPLVHPLTCLDEHVDLDASFQRRLLVMIG